MFSDFLTVNGFIVVLGAVKKLEKLSQEAARKFRIS
jgi:hypothetical protein